MPRGRKPYKNRDVPMDQQTPDHRIDSDFTRNEERVDRSIDTRAYDDFYDFPDFDQIELTGEIPLNLMGPPARIDERHGKMHQHWANRHLNNGRRIFDLRQKGYRPRDPNTVSPQFRGFTSQWDGRDVIMVADSMVLMEIPLFQYEKMVQVKIDRNRSRVDMIRSSHGSVNRDGEIQHRKMDNIEAFSKLVEVDKEISNRPNGEREVRYAD